MYLVRPFELPVLASLTVDEEGKQLRWTVNPETCKLTLVGSLFFCGYAWPSQRLSIAYFLDYNTFLPIIVAVSCPYLSSSDVFRISPILHLNTSTSPRSHPHRLPPFTAIYAISIVPTSISSPGTLHTPATPDDTSYGVLIHHIRTSTSRSVVTDVVEFRVGGRRRRMS
ncbi:hypothetical protein BC829DRAFT_284209 [Chytridium lagenaria]|nr:hypothetical protein BC829DRAFT_284209 [Chytridium lagenaria]